MGMNFCDVRQNLALESACLLRDYPDQFWVSAASYHPFRIESVPIHYGLYHWMDCNITCDLCLKLLLLFLLARQKHTTAR